MLTYDRKIIKLRLIKLGGVIKNVNDKEKHRYKNPLVEFLVNGLTS